MFSVLKAVVVVEVCHAIFQHQLSSTDFFLHKMRPRKTSLIVAACFLLALKILFSRHRGEIFPADDEDGNGIDNGSNGWFKEALKGGLEDEAGADEEVEELVEAVGTGDKYPDATKVLLLAYPR